MADNILHFIELYKINAVITFDKYGVSKHKNHISLFYGMASLCMDKKVPACQYFISIKVRFFLILILILILNLIPIFLDCKLYVLESVNIIRKYTQILDLPISLLSASYWYMVTYDQRQYIKVKKL